MRTEEINPRTLGIDTLTTGEILQRINEEDATVAGAVARELPTIEAVVERVVTAFQTGGRLIYVGAGTSGRIAVLDAAECPPTFGTDPRQVRALIAGGTPALVRSAEAAEDDEEQGAHEMDALGVDKRDVVLGIAASGRTPYVVGALRRARSRGACAAALVGNRAGSVAGAADLVIAPDTGPEVLAGSTRMKAGTAQKLVLNMISTTAMIRTGHTYGNLMVDMRASNSKLRTRACGIIAQTTGVGMEEAERVLTEAGGDLKIAVVMLLVDVSVAEARIRLAEAGGVVRHAVRTESRS
jgi:N-acetylmuramic acid 6-phosphate etherase